MIQFILYVLRDLTIILNYTSIELKVKIWVKMIVITNMKIVINYLRKEARIYMDFSLIGTARTDQ